ncbi:PRC-barrel domain protein [Sporotomaculum syntrophicum]|uniref:PRC-barrel domain protein n=1 Tax=Sporotomaculum syntrophicum TaxID=182264 RepID=A0A9D2WR85_9FIRM|nr:YlmC/YmxH family sporulation protein [Sporotomaculum syntrophicum]KAF1086100.1 PRC-barrel domain protein [Sporotomaculum syntrophicum]
MLKITELSRKDIINIKNGAKLGAVRDVHVDLADGKVRAIVLEGPKRYFRLLGAGGDIIIPWEKIKTIGVDAVLVELD